MIVQMERADSTGRTGPRMNRANAMTRAAPLLPFVQLEFTHALGPAPGRYVVSEEADASARDLDSADVLVLDAVPAPAVRRGRRHRRGLDSGAAAADVSLAVATHIKPTLAEDGAAWVQACEEDPAMQAGWLAEALALLNRAVRAHRASCGDPYFPELLVSDPRTVRIGYGTASEVAAGRWAYAFAVGRGRSPRLGHAERNAAPEVVAAALGGRPVLLQADELVLRGLLDLDHGRLGCAALQLHAAARMLAAELAGVDVAPGLEARVRALSGIVEQLDHAVRDPLIADDDAEARLQETASALRQITDGYRTGVLAYFRPGP